MLSNSIFMHFHSSPPSGVGIDSVGASQGGCHPPSHQPAATWVETAPEVLYGRSRCQQDLTQPLGGGHGWLGAQARAVDG